MKNTLLFYMERKEIDMAYTKKTVTKTEETVETKATEKPKKLLLILTLFYVVQYVLAV